jgi:predicted RNA binding protein YcfA (HicA-like mRNA interferase family)
MASFYRDLTKILSDNGYVFSRSGKGDHEIWLNKETGNKVTVDAGITSRHTANEILKKAGLPKAF